MQSQTASKTSSSTPGVTPGGTAASIHAPSQQIGSGSTPEEDVDMVQNAGDTHHKRRRQDPHGTDALQECEHPFLPIVFLVFSNLWFCQR